MSLPKPRVLVLDEHLRQALATVRALGKAGVEVESAGYLKATLAGSSRYTSRRHRLPSPGVSASSFSRALDAILAEARYDAVFASDDGTIEQLRAQPPPVPCVPDVRGDALAPLINKVQLRNLAATVSVPYPETQAVTGPSSVSAIVGDFDLPLVIKPESSATIRDDQALVRKGATIARTREEAEAAVARMLGAGVSPIAQRFVERIDKINVTIFRRDLESEVRFPYRVVRDVPIGAGIGVALESIPVDSSPGADAVSALERICDAAGYSGVVNGEFCLVGDGSLVLIETNARPWGSLWFSEQQGHRFSERCLRLARGEPGLDPAPAGRRRRFHHPLGEIQWARLHGLGWRSFKEVLRTTGPTDVYEYFDWRDPKPLLSLGWSVAKRRVHPPDAMPVGSARAVHRIGD